MCSTMLRLFPPIDDKERQYPLVMRVSLGVSIDCRLLCCGEVEKQIRKHRQVYSDNNRLKQLLHSRRLRNTE